MSTIEEGREELRQRASILREYAGELQQVRGTESPNAFSLPVTERITFLASEPTGYHTIMEALAYYADEASAVSYEAHERFTQLSEQNAPTSSRLPEKLDPYRDNLQRQYEKIAGITNDLRECLGNAAVTAGFLRNHGGFTALGISKNLETELLQRAQTTEQDADRL